MSVKSLDANFIEELAFSPYYYIGVGLELGLKAGLSDFLLLFKFCRNTRAPD